MITKAYNALKQESQRGDFVDLVQARNQVEYGRPRYSKLGKV